MSLKIRWPLASCELHTPCSAWTWRPLWPLLRRRCEHVRIRGPTGPASSRCLAPPPGAKAGGQHPVDGQKKSIQKYIFFLVVYFFFGGILFPFVSHSLCKKSILKYIFFSVVYFSFGGIFFFLVWYTFPSPGRLLSG